MEIPGFECSRCGRWHDQLPFAYHAPAPVYWSEASAQHPESALGEEQCILNGEHFFVRGRIRIPVLDADEDFEWGVWVSLSEENFVRMGDAWEQEGREREEPMFGWLSNELSVYDEPTLNLPALVRTQPVGLRPLVELETDADHPLAREQRDGITLARVQELAERLLH